MFPRTSTPLHFTAAMVIGVAFAASLHAAPLLDGKPIVEAKRAEATARAKRIAPPSQRYVPGQPVRFPRELLPQLLREFEADMDDAFDDDGDVGDVGDLDAETQDIEATSAPKNRLMHDPSDDPPSSTQSENTIAAFGKYLVGGWNESADPGMPRSFSGFGFSRDGGKTWTDGGTLPRADSVDFFVGDPCLTVDGEGNFYYASLYTADGLTLGVSVSRGRFRGDSFRFQPPVQAGIPGADGLDKEWIAADPVNGNLYVTYTRFFETGASQIELVRSRDHGRTWSPPLVLSDTTREGTQGSRVAVGPDHEVYVAYAAIDLEDFTTHMRIRKSTNLGKRFGREVNVGEDEGNSGVSPNFVNGPPGFNRPGGVEFPSLAVDRSKGSRRGDVYLTWPEAVNYFADELGGAGVEAEAEGNDTPAAANPFTLGFSLTGTLGIDRDPDWFSFSGRKGQTVEFLLVPAPGSTADGFMRLFCRNGELGDRLAFSYLGGGVSFIVFTLPADGTFLLRVLPINPQATLGDYFVFTGTHRRHPLDVARDARDVVLSRSRDGIHWSRRQVVNDDAGHFDNAFPEVAVDDRGDVHLVWYDHRNDRACGILTDLYRTRSSNGGRSFRDDAQVNDGPGINWNLVPSRLAPNMGDYISLTADGGNVYANWADGRLGTPDSWMAKISSKGRQRSSHDAAIATRAPAIVHGPQFALHVMNPARLGTPVTLSFELPRTGPAQVEIFSVAGQKVRTLLDGTIEAGAHQLTWDARGRDGAEVAPGVYFAVLRSGERKLTRRVVMLQ